MELLGEWDPALELGDADTEAALQLILEAVPASCMSSSIAYIQCLT